MKTVEYLDACKKRLELTSDYQLSQALGLTRSALSIYRNKGGTFNADTATKVAGILGIHPLRVIADAEQERAKTPEQRALWRELAAKIGAVLVVAGVGGLLTNTAGVAEARFYINKSSAPSSPTSRPYYALHAIRRWLRKLLAGAALALGASGAIAGDPWTGTDKALGAAALGALALDWGQTRYIAKNPDAFHEKNGSIGQHPSLGRVNAYFAGAILGTVLVANALPAGWRSNFLGAVTVVELYAVGRNASLGIRVSF